MDSLKVYKSNFEKIRIGSANDGGYIIADLPNNYDCFISCGVSDDINRLIKFNNYDAVER